MGKGALQYGFFIGESECKSHCIILALPPHLHSLKSQCCKNPKNFLSERDLLKKIFSLNIPGLQSLPICFSFQKVLWSGELGGGVCVCVSWIHSKQCVVVLRYRNYQAVLLREMSPTDGPLYAVGHSFWPVQGDLALLCNFVKQRPFWLISPWNFELEDRMFSSKLDYVFINILGSHYKLYGWTRVVTLGALLLRFCHM